MRVVQQIPGDVFLESGSRASRIQHSLTGQNGPPSYGIPVMPTESTYADCIRSPTSVRGSRSCGGCVSAAPANTQSVLDPKVFASRRLIRLTYVSISAGGAYECTDDEESGDPRGCDN